ncbi:MAG: tyrosine-type recombinase/integrase [Gemmatimonadota bacterium]|nr:tyrosine-type recombinase/integrase [Gemmatimonadota bacterium]MDQ6888352.1 tyrosine-type recombinase/integrase [Gemmatimonadota bacterium]
MSYADLPPPQHPEVHPEPNYDPVHRFAAWLERMGKAEATVAAYHADVADLTRAYAPRPVEQLLASDLSHYLSARAGFEGWAPPTVRRHLQAIRAFYRYLVSDEELRAPGPAEALVEPVSDPRPPSVISLPDVRQLFAYLERRAREPQGSAERMDLALYGLCYHSALLVSEAIGLMRDAVRGGPTAMQIDVVGRRREETRVTVEGEGARWLASWMSERPEPKRPEHRAFVFIHPRTRVHTSRQRAWDRLKRVAAAAGLDAEVAAQISPHALRHSYAAHLAARALGVADLRAALRQHSPRHAAKYLVSARP